MALFDMAGHLIRRLQQTSTRIFQQHMQALGLDLTSVQFAALSVLRDNPGIEQARIAALIAYDRATIGGVIDRLERKGYVERHTSDQDRRAKSVRLTDLGRRTLEQVSPIVTALQDDILGGLSETERQQFLQYAQKVLMASEEDNAQSQS